MVIGFSWWTLPSGNISAWDYVEAFKEVWDASCIATDSIRWRYQFMLLVPLCISVTGPVLELVSEDSWTFVRCSYNDDRWKHGQVDHTGRQVLTITTSHSSTKCSHWNLDMFCMRLQSAIIFWFACTRRDSSCLRTRTSNDGSSFRKQKKWRQQNNQVC